MEVHDTQSGQSTQEVEIEQHVREAAPRLRRVEQKSSSSRLSARMKREQFRQVNDLRRCAAPITRTRPCSSARVDPVEIRRPSEALNQFGIIYFGNDWLAENRTSSHHIAEQLATRTRV